MNKQKLLFWAFIVGFVALAGFSWAAQDGSGAPEQAQTGNGVGEQWLTAVQEQIRQTEYQISWQAETPLPDVAGAYQAPNRVHDFRTYFTGDGVRVVPRQQADWRWSLSLAAVGDGQQMQAVEQAQITAVGNRVTYQRGDLAEWYVNDNRGVEQGFTIAAAPAGAAGDVLALDMTLGGDLRPAMAADGQAIEFVTADGRLALRYSDLYAFDAQQRPLPAQMTLLANNGETVIRLAVDTSAAAYPLVIDPLIAVPDWEAGTVQNDDFGFAVAAAGDVNGDGYDDVIVGAPLFDGGQVDEGAAFVYLGSPAGLSAVFDWKAESNVANRQGGVAVAGAGDVNNDGYDDVIIGSRGDSAALYLGGPGGLGATAAWTGNGPAGSGFGTAVAGAGDVNDDGFADVIIGAPQARNSANVIVGRAFVYYGSGSGLPATANWRAESDLPNANFGISVDGAGDVNNDGFGDVIIGADKYAPDGALGAAAVFYGGRTGMSGGPLASIANAPWVTYGFSVDSSYGFAVAAAGDVDGDGVADVLVGAPTEFNGSLGETGAVYLFASQNLGNGYTLPFSPTRLLYGESAGDRFGHAVAGAGDINRDGFDDVLVGAPNYVEPEAGQGVEGALTIFLGTDDGGIVPSPSWVFSSGQNGARFGHAVSGAGDVNGDGYADLVVGAPQFVGGAFARGRAFGFHGTGEITDLQAFNSSPTAVNNPTIFYAQTSSPDSGLNSFTWEFGNGDFGIGRETVYTYDTPGIYTATVTAENPFSLISATTIVTITQNAPVTPGGGGTLSFTDSQGRGTTVNVPPGAVKTPLILTYTPISMPSQPKPANSINYYFDLDVAQERLFLPLVFRAGGGSLVVEETAVSTAVGQSAATNQPAAANADCPPGHFCFEAPVTITITYNEALLEGQNEDELTLVFWDSESQTWIDAATTCTPASQYQRDLANNRFSIAVCHLSRFGVVGAN